MFSSGFAIAVLSLTACTGAPERTPRDAPLPASATPGAPERNAAFASAKVPAPSRLKTILPAYPKEVTGTPAGTVTLRITIDASGRVVDAVQPFVPDYSTRVLGEQSYLVGRPLPMAFVDSAVASVRQWQYTPPGAAARSVYVQFSFSPGVATFVSWQDDQPPPAAGDGSVVKAGITFTGDRTVPLPPDTREPVRINGPVTAPRKIKDVRPVYPTASAAHIRGVVIVEVRVDVSGRVVDARVLRSLPFLDEAALEAARQWEFAPALLNGRPIPIVMSAAVRF